MGVSRGVLEAKTLNFELSCLLYGHFYDGSRALLARQGCDVQHNILVDPGPISSGQLFTNYVLCKEELNGLESGPIRLDPLQLNVSINGPLLD